MWLRSPSDRAAATLGGAPAVSLWMIRAASTVAGASATNGKQIERQRCLRLRPVLYLAHGWLPSYRMGMSATCLTQYDGNQPRESSVFHQRQAESDEQLIVEGEKIIYPGDLPLPDRQHLQRGR